MWHDAPAMSETNQQPDARRPLDARDEAHGATAQPAAGRPPAHLSGDTAPLTPAAGVPWPGPGMDLEATLPLVPAVGPAGMAAGTGAPFGQPTHPTPPGGWPPADPSPWGQWPGGQPAYPGPYPQDAYAADPYGQGHGPYPQAAGPYPQESYTQSTMTGGWQPEDGPQVGTAYGTRPPRPPSGNRRAPASGGAGGGGRTPSAIIVGSVISVAAILAVAVWFLLLRPMGDTASATPSPTATTYLTPPPTAIPETTDGTETAAPSPAPTRVRNPTFSGLRVADAQRLADRSSIRIVVTYEVTDEVDPDTVIDQDPAAGEELRPGDVVTLTVAAPAPTVAVPDLRGFSEEDAVAALLDTGLGVGERTEAFDPDTGAGLIIRTEPRGGIAVARGTPIDYLVSLGAPPSPSVTPAPTSLPVPDLSTLTADEAQAVADAHGFRLDVREQETLDVEPGQILSQEPPPGTPIMPGELVTIVIAVQPPTVVVPDVRGFPEEDALSALFDAGLVPGDRGEAFDASADPGVVLRTEPRAGVAVAPGTAVDYLVSLGAEPTPTSSPTPRLVRVPDLRGRSIEDARSLATDAELVLRVEERESLDVDPGIVLEQDPDVDAEVIAGSTVVVEVAVRPDQVAVPALRDLPEADAIAALEAAALVPGERSERFHASVREGAVIRTDPAAGTIVELGTPVDYSVSRGPEPTPSPSPTPEPTLVPVDLPDLAGRTLVEVQAFADDHQLRLDVAEQDSEDAPEGTILDQDPRGGSRVRRGDTVRVTVARRPATVVVPPLRGLAESDAVAALLDADLVPGERSERFHGSVPAGAVILTDPRAGERVPRGSAVAYALSAGPEPTATPQPTPVSIAVPSFVGGPVGDARAWAASHDLRLATTVRETADVPPDMVLEQDPVEGGTLRRGDTLRVVVAAPPTTIAVPTLRGQAEADAIATLLDAGLAVGTRQERFHASVPPGAVIRTQPSAGEVVPLGTPVDYLVSKGPEPTPEPTPSPTPEPTASPTPAAVGVPVLRGLTEADGITLLLDAGLVPGRRIDRFNDAVPADLIVRTAPAAGELVAPGSVVDYVVSRGPNPGEPTPEPTDEPTLEPIPGPTDEPGGDGGLVTRVEAVVGSVPPLRELEQLAGVPVRLMGGREFRQTLRAGLESSPGETATLVRLGLIPPEIDLARTRLDLAANGVVAWYDPAAGVLNVIRRDGTTDAVLRFFAAGQADTALIDQHVGLASWRPEDPTQTDRLVARQGLLGGDQAVLMIDWAGVNLSPDEQSTLPGLVPTDPSVLDAAPLYLRRMATFPSDAGRAFVDALRGVGGWAAVNDAYARPPASTEQILHPERYRQDRPVGIDLEGALGLVEGGWSLTDTRTLGELGIGLWLDDGVDGSPNAWAADGWGGDRLATLDGPDGAWAVIWQTAWDTPTDAEEFSGMADQAMADLPGAHAVLLGADLTGTGLPSPSLVIVASDQSVLDGILVRAGLGG